MIGQKKLTDTFARFTMVDLPKTMLFIGEDGCGKRCFTKELAKDKLLTHKYIDNSFFKGKSAQDINAELTEYQFSLLPTLFVIDIRNVSELHQNQLLKFIEEPGKNAFIALLANNEANVINTVLNRCTKFKFAQYTEDELKKVHFLNQFDNPLYYKICRTPGRVLTVDSQKLAESCEVCNVIIKNINSMTFCQLLKVANIIKKKDDDDKINFDLFLDTLSTLAFLDYSTNNNRTSIKIYNKTKCFIEENLMFNFINEHIVLNFLTELFTEVRLCN